MQIIQFDKMHGAGNDYIYIDARKYEIKEPAALAVKMSNRHTGVGSDGLVLIMDSEVAHFRMRMFNADGSESGMCGNASRCVGKYLYEKGITDRREIGLETGSGVKQLQLQVSGRIVEKISVDMDVPGLEAHQIPVRCSDPSRLLLDGLIFTCVSMGNPHAVTFVEDTQLLDVQAVGKSIENSPLFPDRTNVEFAQILAPDRIRMRVWERGSGETRACGTGACATLVAAVLQGKARRTATLELPGGELEIAWNEQTGSVILTGGATWIFNGQYAL